MQELVCCTSRDVGTGLLQVWKCQWAEMLELLVPDLLLCESSGLSGKGCK